jgi:membrane protease YdiL (CAAX protease family)
VLGWSVLLFLAQAAAGILVALVVPALRGVSPDNTSVLVGLPVAELLLVAVAAVVIAPVVEEQLFRGLLLQGLMLRSASGRLPC